MKYLLITALLLSHFCIAGSEDDLSKIKNYQKVSSVLSSAGLPTKKQLSLLNDAGFKHVINLIPGDHNEERRIVNAMGISFDQIEVDWDNPTLENFRTFAALMDKYSEGRTLVHCQLNYRATAFVHLYELTHGEDASLTEEQMKAIWTPEGTWANFVAEVKAAYNN